MASQRNRILQAAADEVAAVGLRRTTLTDVARRAGVSRMTVYREYGDAPALFRALLTSTITEVIAEAQERTQQLPTVRARLVDGVVHAVDALSRHQLMQRVLELDPELVLPFVVDRFGSGQRLGLARLEQLLEEGKADGSIAVIDVAATARLILLSLQSVLFAARIPEVQESASTIRAELRRMLDAYLGAPDLGAAA
jgi:AcrR family transcriptional regulator